MSRPRGARREALSGWVTAHGQFTLGTLARTMCWPMSVADSTVRRAMHAGEIEKAGTVRQGNAKRPVAVYAPAGSANQRTGTHSLQALLRVWPR